MNPSLVGKRHLLAGGRRMSGPKALRAQANDSPSTSVNRELVILLKRQLRIAVQEEDYETASRIKSQLQASTASLPWQQQVIFACCEKLQSDSLEAKVEALHSLSMMGDESVIPALAAQLHDPRVRPMVEKAMRDVLARHPDPVLNETMLEGCRYMQENNYDMARQKFEECRDADPQWAEAWNKLATIKYLCRQFSESIADCEKAYELQPFHFGAVSGMGLNYLGLRQTKNALKYFKKALAINPGLDNLKKYVDALQSSQSDTLPDDKSV